MTTEEKTNDAQPPAETSADATEAAAAASADAAPVAKKKRVTKKRVTKKKRVAKAAPTPETATDVSDAEAPAADAVDVAATADAPVAEEAQRGEDAPVKKKAAKKRPAKKRPRRSGRKSEAEKAEEKAVHPAFFPAVGDDGPHPAFLPAMGADEEDEDEDDKDPPEIPTDRIDADALWVVRRLRAKGHEAYLTGGCVRDLLLGVEPKDFDVATAAHPDEVKRVFRNCRLVGRRFRLAHVIFAGGKVVETATFRKSPHVNDSGDDGDTDSEIEDNDDGLNEESDARADAGDDGFDGADAADDDGESEAKGDDENSGADLLVERDNEFGNVQEDAVRRDFTINGLFYDPVAGKVLDYVDGRVDVEKKILRTIGDADIRFQEDPVRILRAIKFAARLGFNIEAEADAAMKKHAPELLRCAPARLLDEVMRLFTSGHAAKSYTLLDEYGVLDVLLPEVKEVLNRALSAPVVEEAPPAADEAPPAAAPVEAEAAPAPARKTIDIDSFDDGANDDDDDDVVGIAAQLSTASDAAKSKRNADNEDNAENDAPLVMPTPPRSPPKTPEERTALMLSLLGVLDEVQARGADISSSIAIGTLLWPGYEALVAAGEDGIAFVDELGAQWAERIRMTRRDRETVRLLLGAQDGLHPGWRHGIKAKSLVARPWFREALMLRIVIGRATEADLSDVALWKAIASNYNKPYKQPKKGERVQRPRRSRRSRGGSGGGRGNNRGGGGGRRGGRRR